MKEARDFSGQIQKPVLGFDEKAVQQQYCPCAPILPFQHCSHGDGKVSRETRPGSWSGWKIACLNKTLNFRYFSWTNFGSPLRAELGTTVLTQLWAQARTQLPLESFTLSTIQTLLQRTLENVPVRVIGIFGITDVCMAVADTAPSNADIFDAVVILENTREVGH